MPYCFLLLMRKICGLFSGLKYWYVMIHWLLFLLCVYVMLVATKEMYDENKLKTLYVPKSKEICGGLLSY